MLFGAPGVGKGTYGRLISNEFKIPVFSMGDYLRKLIKQGAEQAEENLFLNDLKKRLS